MAKGGPQKLILLAMLMALPPLYFYNREGLYKIQRRLAGTQPTKSIMPLDASVLKDQKSTTKGTPQ